MTDAQSTKQSRVWVWWVCVLLLLASTVNYMDRQTLSNTAVQIMDEFQLSKEQYGRLEQAFGVAFAIGSIFFGIVADRTSVRWLYPTVLTLWSAMGVLTGFVKSYEGLMVCRLFLGLFEAGHWPCALRTTQRLLPPSNRTLGNSVLQSGAAIGAIATPIIIRWTVTDEVGSWRPVFQCIGALGVVWVALWLVSVRADSFATPAANGPTGNGHEDTPASFWRVVFSRQFLVLLLVVNAINLCWHQFRVWMPQFLETGRGFSKETSLDVVTWFNVMTDIGCLAAGAATALLFRRGLTVFSARVWVFAVCSLLVAAGLAIPALPSDWQLITVMMLVGLGALGLFPCFYAFSQELTAAHQGKIIGVLGTSAWLVASLWHPRFGRYVDTHKSYELGMQFACVLPLLALLVLLLFWPRPPRQAAAASDV